MKITNLSETQFLNRFELIEGVYHYNNENTHPNELFIIDNPETAMSNTKMIYTVLERINKTTRGKLTYQIDIDSTIAANDDIHANKNDGRYGMEVIIFEVLDETGQYVLGEEIPAEILNILAYFVDSLGYHVDRKNDYVNILGYLNTLLTLGNHLQTNPINIYQVTPQTNEYLHVLNINEEINPKAPVYLSLFAKCNIGNSNGIYEYEATIFSEAIGLNVFADKIILQTLTKFKKNGKAPIV